MPRIPTRIFALALALAALALVAYGPALHGEPLWDDEAHITRPALRSLAGLARIWTDPSATQQYYPLTHSAFWLQAMLWGDHTLGYHLVNLALHLAAALLVWRILSVLEIPGAFLAAGIFALHPVHVESVAWISELKNTLSGVFYLSALLAYLRFDAPDAAGEAGSSAAAINAPRRWRWYFLALGLFILALLSKTITASLPAAILLILWHHRGRLTVGRDVLPLVPWFVLGAALGLTTAWIEKHYIGAHGEAFDFSFAQRLLIAGRVVWFYLAKLLAPVNLIFIYERWRIDAGLWWQWIFPLAAAAVPITLLLLRRRLGRGPLTAVLFFGGTLFPVMGFFNVFPFVYAFVADHFQYLASLGIISLVAALVAGGLSRLGLGRAWPGRAVAALLLALLTLLSWHRAHAFVNIPTLYQDILARNPGCSMAHNNYGVYLRNHKHKARALEHFERAVQAEPTNSIARLNIGASLVDAGRFDEALVHLQHGLSLNPANPDLYKAMAIALLGAHRPQQAGEYLRQSLRLHPRDPDALNMLGTSLLEMGSADQAVELFQQARTLAPEPAESCFNLGRAMEVRGRPDDAIAWYRQALEVRPDMPEAHTNLGNLLVLRGELAAAGEHFRAALDAQPDFVEALVGLASVHLRENRPEQAISPLTQALRLQPNRVEARFSLGTALAMTGRHAAAIETLRATVALDPRHARAHHNLASQYFLTGELARAAEHYRQALAIDPAYDDAHFNLAQVLAETGELEQAAHHFEAALARRGDWPEAHLMLGSVLQNLGLHDQARDHLCQARDMARRIGREQVQREAARLLGER